MLGTAASLGIVMRFMLSPFPWCIDWCGTQKMRQLLYGEVNINEASTGYSEAHSKSVEPSLWGVPSGKASWRK